MQSRNTGTIRNNPIQRPSDQAWARPFGGGQPRHPIANRASMGTPREVFVPDIGDFKNVDVVEVLVKPGDTVKPEQSLISVESDKATMEIPSPAAGVGKEMRVKTGDKG